MVESWVEKKQVDQKSSAYIKDPDTPTRIQSARKKGKGKQWVGMASVAFANSPLCLRVELLKYLDDKSGNCSEDVHLH